MTIKLNIKNIKLLSAYDIVQITKKHTLNSKKKLFKIIFFFLIMNLPYIVNHKFNYI